MTKHVVTLTAEQQQSLESVVRCGTHPARKITRARILLQAHQGRGNAQIAQALGVGRSTIERARKGFVAQGLAAIERRPQPPRPQKRKLDGAAEARLAMLACSTPPDGRDRWTLQLLADRMAALAYVDGPVSDETVRRALKKTTSSRG